MQVKNRSYFVTFEKCDADSVCGDCLRKFQLGRDAEVKELCGEVFSHKLNPAGVEYGKKCDFCFITIDQDAMPPCCAMSNNTHERGCSHR